MSVLGQPQHERDRSVRHNWLGTLARAARTPRGRLGLSVAVLVTLIAVVGPFIAPHSPKAFTTTPFSPPASGALLGGDVLGRDVLSRLLCGGWLVMLMALAATLFGVTVGSALGIAAAHLDDWRDGLIMRTADVLLAFPSLVFALLLVSIVGPKVWLIILAVGLAHVPQVARVIRSATLDVSERDFVSAAALQGVSPVKVMSSEILPNVVTPLTVETGLRLTYSIVIIAGLSFLGFGQEPPAANWGIMINENRLGLAANPLAVVAPAVMIALLTVGCNLFTDAVARVSVGIERADDLTLLSPIATDAGLVAVSRDQ
jgi:peptide/nickel transport system permease protein